MATVFFIDRNEALDALDEALETYGPDASVLAMPFGGATLPVVTEKGR